MSRSLPLLRPSQGLTLVYDQVASRWQATVTRLGFPAAYTHLFETEPPMADAASVLDLGTGTGAFAEVCLAHLPRQVGPLTLLDTSSEMLSIARRRFWRLPILALKDCVGTERIAPLSQDIVLGAHIFEHLTDPDAALRWSFERLRPGGQLFLAVSRPHWCTSLLRWKWGHAAWSPETVLSMLERNGFESATHVAFPAGPPARTSAGYMVRRPR